MLIEKGQVKPNDPNQSRWYTKPQSLSKPLKEIVLEQSASALILPCCQSHVPYAVFWVEMVLFSKAL